VLEFPEEQGLLLLRPSALGDVAGDLRGADDPPLAVPERRYRERDLDQRAVLAAADGLVVLDALAAPDALEDPGLLVGMIGGISIRTDLPIASAAV
jgi:hypothetical protein